MIVKMTYKDLVSLWNAIYEIGERKGTKFAYAVLKTKQNIEPLINELARLQLPPKRFVEYDEKRIALCTEYSDKDENGNPKTDGDNFVVDSRRSEFDEKMKALSEEYSDAQSEFESKIFEYNAKLGQSVEVSIHKIPISDFPSDMTSTELERFMVFVSE